MNWCDERYVRLYTRDTESWLVLSWRARALLCFCIRKVDRAGVIETRLGARGLAVIVGMPADEVEAVLPELLEDGCVVQHDRGYVLPNFTAAQDTPQSDKNRSLQYRERRRRDALASATGEHERSPRDELQPADRDARRHVTKRDGSATKRDAIATSHHASSHSVTPSGPDQPDQEEAGSRPTSRLDQQADAIATAVVGAIKGITGAVYSANSKDTRAKSRALAKEGLAVDDVVRAVEHVARGWLGTQYPIRPATLLQLSRVRTTLEDLAARGDGGKPPRNATNGRAVNPGPMTFPLGGGVTAAEDGKAVGS